MADPALTPAGELRAAAAKLREMAGEATPGPWRDLPMGSDGSVVLAGGDTIRTARRPARCGEFADAAWIALMGPSTAAGIAALLEHHANCVAWADNWDSGLTNGDSIKQFARSILGSS